MSESDWACLICCDISAYKVLGKCNHPICLTCSARQRDLCEQKFCAVCREDLEKVLGVFQFSEGTFKELETRCKVSGHKPGYKFEDRKIFNAFRDLFAMKCKICKKDTGTIQSLEFHLKREHARFLCQICKDNLKVLVRDMSVYSKEELRVHRVKGDPNDSSMKGHPLCEFCHDRYLDSEVLHLHLRKNHFWCHICEGQAFYCAYKDLKLHFAKAHFVCEKGDCANEQLTNVFRSEIDLQAHIASRHATGMGKAALRQMRQIQPAFTTSGRASRRGELPESYSSDFCGAPQSNRQPRNARSNPRDQQLTYGEPLSISSRNPQPNARDPPPISRNPPPISRDPPPISRDPPPGSRDPPPVSKQPKSTSNKAVPSSLKHGEGKQGCSKAGPAGPSSEEGKPSVSNGEPVSYRRRENGNNQRPSDKRPSDKRPPVDPIRCEEPDVGNPPEDCLQLRDDGDYRKKGKSAKAKAVKIKKIDKHFPKLESNSAEQPPQAPTWGRGPLPSQPKQNRKQGKDRHQEEYNDADFQWLQARKEQKPPQPKAAKGKDKKKTKPSSNRLLPPTVFSDFEETDSDYLSAHEVLESVREAPMVLKYSRKDRQNEDIQATKGDTQTAVNSGNKKVDVNCELSSIATEIKDKPQEEWTVSTDRRSVDIRTLGDYPPLAGSVPESAPFGKVPSLVGARGRGSRVRDFPPLQPPLDMGSRSAPVSRCSTPPGPKQEDPSTTVQGPPPSLQEIFCVPDEATTVGPLPTENSLNSAPDSLNNAPVQQSFSPAISNGTVSNGAKAANVIPASLSEILLSGEQSRPKLSADSRIFEPSSAPSQLPSSDTPGIPESAPRPPVSKPTRLELELQSLSVTVNAPEHSAALQSIAADLQRPSGLNNGTSNSLSQPPHNGVPHGSVSGPPGISRGDVSGPPGLQRAAPPPGLKPASPPGLTENHKYIPVTQYKQRFDALEAYISQRVGPDISGQFWSAFKAFTNRQMSGGLLTNICRKFLGREWEPLLETMLVLIPDIELQGALYRGLGLPKALFPCSVCKQILTMNDLLHHSDFHPKKT